VGIKVVSLFDGYAGAYQALKILGLEVDEYHASEVDKPAMRVARKNHPDINYLGDVRFVNALLDGLEDTDLLIGGSPCQGFSFAGKQLNFEDPRSKLFFEFARLRDEIQPKYFLLENVNMKKEYRDVISSYLGVEPININSWAFSAQDRNRWYWTNLPVAPGPYDPNTETAEDILEDEVGIKYYIEPKRSVIICENEVKKRKIGYIGSDSQGNRIYNIHGKAVALCGGSGGLGAKTGLYALPCITPDRLEKRQNGRRFKPPHSKFYTLTAQDKHGVLTNNFIRKLTPIECERLQTLPDNYTDSASDTQRQRMLGNGFTIEVIIHILSYMLVAEL
jgi:site-specific DNA-cytosine methylase